MANNVVHFAVHADDVPRARAFYEAVFQWAFEPWGPPDFFLIHTGEPGEGIHGALQKRLHPLVGDGMRGYECTIGVEDLAKTCELVKKHGGNIVFGPQDIPTVGSLIQFTDTEGNVVCAMQYSQSEVTTN